MRTRQRGVTVIGWIILMIPFAIVGYAGIRLAPVYLNYMKVVRALDEVAGDPDGASMTPETIRMKIDRHFEIDMVDYPTAKDMKITRDGTTGRWSRPTRTTRRCSRIFPCTWCSTSWSTRGVGLGVAASAMERRRAPGRWVRAALGYQPRELGLFAPP